MFLKLKRLLKLFLGIEFLILKILFFCLLTEYNKNFIFVILLLVVAIAETSLSLSFLITMTRRKKEFYVNKKIKF